VRDSVGCLHRSVVGGDGMTLTGQKKSPRRHQL
jgi:hypothetical protein